MAAAAISRSCRSFLTRRRLSTLSASSLTPSASEAPASSSSTAINRLKSAIRAESDPEKILDLFQSSTHLPHFYFDRFLYQISVKRLYRFRRLDLVERLLESQKSDPAAPKSEGFYTHIMSLYTQASMPDHAIRTFEQIPAPTEKSILALISAYLEQRRFDLVRDLFDSFPDKYGIFPSVVAHNMLLTALCETGEMDAARKLFDEMKMKEEWKPDIISYNSILSGYLKNEDMVGFEDTMKEIYNKGIAHNVITYNLRILNFCNKSESFKAEELLDLMTSKGILPNLSTFSTIIEGFCKERDLEAAIKVFERMKVMKRANGKKGFSPNVDIYNVLIRGLVDKEDFSLAQKICQECLIRKYAPPFEIFKALISGLVKDSKITDAKNLADMMRKVAKGDAIDSWKKIEAELSL